MKRVLVYKRFERFWHWMQALLIIILALTGFEIRGSFTLLGFETAVKVHDIALWAFLILSAFAIFWHFTTGEWKKYISGGRDQKASVMIKYYTSGVFKNEPHPYKKTELSRLNPLQRVTYMVLKLILIPILAFSGLLYYFSNDLAAMGYGNLLDWVRPLHTLGAFALIAFFIVHVYMTTTGYTVTSNLKAMVSGYEDLESAESVERKQAGAVATD